MLKDKTQKINTFFFDMDGTIVDTGFIARSIMEYQVTKELKLDVADPNRGFKIGDKMETIWNRFIDFYSPPMKDQIPQITKRSHELLIDAYKKVDLPIRNGFWELIKYIKDKKMHTGLVTSTDKSVAEMVLKNIGAETAFDIVVTGDMVKHTKPNPEIYNLACKMIKKHKDQVLVFEDSDVGVESALKAGLQVIGVISEGRTELFSKENELLTKVDNFEPIPYLLQKNREEYQVERLHVKIIIRDLFDTSRKTQSVPDQS